MSESIADFDPMPRYPEVSVQLLGRSGNALMILASVRTALRKAGVPAEQLAEFTDEAMGGDYDHLLQTAMRWVNVE